MKQKKSIISTRKKLLIEENKLLLERIKLNRSLKNVREELFSLDVLILRDETI